MELQTNERVSSGSDWREWSKYVLITLEKLGTELDQCNKNYVVLKSDMFIDLTKIKDKLRDEMDKLSIEQSNSCNKIINELESVIKNISNRTTKLEKVDVELIIDSIVDKRLIKLHEDILYPMRIKVMVFGLVSGCVGGLLLSLVPVVVKAVIGG